MSFNAFRESEILAKNSNSKGQLHANNLHLGVYHRVRQRRLRLVWTRIHKVCMLMSTQKKFKLLLMIIYVFSVLCLLSLCARLFIVPCGHLPGKGWHLGSRLWCLTVSLTLSHFGILGQVWYLIVSIPDLCTLTYFLTPSLLHLK